MALPFSFEVDFGGFLLGDVHTGMAGYFPFFSFTIFLVGVGFGLGILNDLGTLVSTSATSGAATYASISTSGTNSLVSLTSAGADVILCNNSYVSIEKVSNILVAIRSS